MQEFDDSAYFEYLKKREQELHGDSIEDLIVPQYISDINAQALQEPDIIYISSDEELEEGEEADDIVAQNVEAFYSDDIVAQNVEAFYSDKSDSSYHTANTNFYSSDDRGPDIERDIAMLNIGSSSNSMRPIEDITNNVIVIDDDSDSESFIKVPREPHPGLDSRNARRIKRALKKRRVYEKDRTQKKDLIRKKTANRPLVYPTVTDPRNIIITCYECKLVTYKNVRDSLLNLTFVRGDSRPFCTGCARLHSFATCEREVTDIIRWFITGRIPSYDLPPKCSHTDIIWRLQGRRRYMVKRSIRSRADASELVTTSELYQICVERDFRCAVSGHALYFGSRTYDRTPYWSLSLDHIYALNYSKYAPISWSKHNIQPLCAVLNSIKGHVPNEELIRWYNGLISSKVIEV